MRWWLRSYKAQARFCWGVEEEWDHWRRGNVGKQRGCSPRLWTMCGRHRPHWGRPRHREGWQAVPGGEVGCADRIERCAAVREIPPCRIEGLKGNSADCLVATERRQSQATKVDRKRKKERMDRQALQTGGMREGHCMSWRSCSTRTLTQSSCMRPQARPELNPVFWRRKWVGAVTWWGTPSRAAVSTSLPVVDWKGDTQLIEAKSVDYIVYSAAARVPKEAAMLFPEMTEEALKAHQTAGQINIIGRNNGRWLTQHVCDSWNLETIWRWWGWSSILGTSWGRQRGSEMRHSSRRRLPRITAPARWQTDQGSVPPSDGSFSSILVAHSGTHSPLPWVQVNTDSTWSPILVLIPRSKVTNLEWDPEIRFSLTDLPRKRLALISVYLCSPKKGQEVVLV